MICKLKILIVLLVACSCTREIIMSKEIYLGQDYINKSDSVILRVGFEANYKNDYINNRGTFSFNFKNEKVKHEIYNIIVDSIYIKHLKDDVYVFLYNKHTYESSVFVINPIAKEWHSFFYRSKFSDLDKKEDLFLNAIIYKDKLLFKLVHENNIIETVAISDNKILFITDSFATNYLCNNIGILGTNR